MTSAVDRNVTTSPRTSQWLIFALLLPVLLLPALISRLAPVPPPDLHYASATARILFGDGRDGEARDLGRIELPDSWNQTRPGFGGLIEYQIELRPLDSSHYQSILIQRAKGACDVMLNGQLLYSEIGQGDSRGTNRVIFVSVPESLRAERNSLTVRLRGYARDGSGLSDLYVGPTGSLHAAYVARWLVSEQLLTIANWSVIALSLPFLFLWLRDPQHSLTYGLFSAGALVFALRNFHRQVDPDLLSGAFWQPLVAASLGWVAVAEWLFLMRYVGVRLPRFERWLLLFTVTGTVMLFVVPASAFALADTLLWRVPIFLSGVFCVAVFTMQTAREPNRSRILLAAGMIAQVAPALHDLLWLMGTIPFGEAQWFPLSFPALFIVMGLILADDMATTRLALREANTDLERKIAQARAELNAMYERQRLQDAERFTLEERGRLMREMHDGVGTHLSLLLSGLQRGNLTEEQVRDSVQLSMDELRLLLDARSASTETLVDAISNLRHRLESRLALAGARSTWQVDDAAETVTLSAEATLHVLRIVQECVTNAVRHGRASRIDYRIRLGAPGDDGRADLCIDIVDDGVGPVDASSATRGSGAGLPNMRARAASLGGRFELQRTGAETTATIALPPSSYTTTPAH